MCLPVGIGNWQLIEEIFSWRALLSNKKGIDWELENWTVTEQNSLIRVVGEYLKLQTVILSSSDVQLPECLRVIGHLRRLATFSEHEMRLQVGITQSLVATTALDPSVCSFSNLSYDHFVIEMFIVKVKNGWWDPLSLSLSQGNLSCPVAVLKVQRSMAQRHHWWPGPEQPIRVLEEDGRLSSSALVRCGDAVPSNLLWWYFWSWRKYWWGPPLQLGCAPYIYTFACAPICTSSNHWGSKSSYYFGAMHGNTLCMFFFWAINVAKIYWNFFVSGLWLIPVLCL